MAMASIPPTASARRVGSSTIVGTSRKTYCQTNTNIAYPTQGASSVRPHAPTSIVGQSVSYDANGNTLSYTVLGQARTLVYDGESHPTSIALAGGVDDVRFGIHGSEGELTIPNWYATELRGGKRSDRKTGPLEIPEMYRLPHDDIPLRAAFRVLLGRMVQAIDNRLPSPSPNFVDGVNSQAVIDAAHLSARQGAAPSLQGNSAFHRSSA